MNEWKMEEIQKKIVIFQFINKQQQQMIYKQKKSMRSVLFP